jgi:hypothetical protein
MSIDYEKEPHFLGKPCTQGGGALILHLLSRERLQFPETQALPFVSKCRALTTVDD